MLADDLLQHLPSELAANPHAHLALTLGTSVSDLVYIHALKVNLKEYCDALGEGLTCERVRNWRRTASWIPVDTFISMRVYNDMMHDNI